MTSQSLNEFIEEHQEKIQRLREYPRLMADRQAFSTKYQIFFGNDMVAKRILNNEYGTITDMSLAKMFRDWCRYKAGVSDAVCC